MCLPILDTPNENIAKYFKQANQFIQDALDEKEEEERTLKEGDYKFESNVLVHWYLYYNFHQNYIVLRESLDLLALCVHT
jgi:hypothetical protein